MRETLAGVRVIRAFVRTRHEEARFDEASRDLMDTGLRVNRLFAITLPALMLIMNLSTVAVMWLGAYRVDSGDMPIGNLTAFLQYIIADPVRDHDRGASCSSWSRGRPSRPAGSARCSTPSPPSATRRRPISPVRRGRRRVPRRQFRYPGAEEPGPAAHLVRGQPRRDDGHRRLHGQRQDHAHQPAAALLRRRPTARCSSTASTSASWTARTCGARIGIVPQKAFLFSGTDRQQPALRRRRTATDERAVARARHRAGPRVRRAEMASELEAARSPRAAPTSRAASASGSRSRARSSSGPTSTSSTTASRRSTSGPTRACARRSGGSWATRR